MTDERRQAQLEYEVAADAEAQAQRLRELKQKSAEGDANLPRASALIKSIYDKVYANLESKLAVRARGINGKYLTWLRAIPLDVATMLSIRTCIQVCTSPANRNVYVQNLTTRLGKLFELEVRIREAEKVNPVYMQRIAAQIKEHGTVNTGHIGRLYEVAIDRVMQGAVDNSLSRTERMQIGKFGVDACFEAGLIVLHTGTYRKGTAHLYELDPEVLSFLVGYNDNDVRRVVNKSEMVMLCPPDSWKTAWDGGYISPRRKAMHNLLNFDEVRKGIRGKLAAELTAEKSPMVFETANYLQAQELTVHEPTREAIVRLWQQGGGTLGVPSKNPPKRPEIPFAEGWIKEEATESELVEFKRWKRKVTEWYEEVAAWRGKALEIGSFIKASRRVGESLWFPVYTDKRGRWYYRGSPNPQGSDLAKSVLHFKERKALGPRGLFWLKVVIANHHGFDAERLADRARWTEQNWASIERALDVPEDHPEVWGKDAPWCMYAAAWELREAYRSGNPHTYKTGLIGHVDATCSGLQHFSAMLRDPVGATYVNLDDPLKCGPKQDIYSRVAAMALSAMQPDLESEDVLVRAMASWWISVGIPRTLAKKPVMTYVYGATLLGTADHIESVMENEVFPDKSITWENPLLSSEYCRYAAKKLFEGVANTVPAAAAGMQWLKSVASQYPNGKPMLWKSPMGFTVIHDYQDSDIVRVRLASCGVESVRVKVLNENTLSHAMRNAISPNFVHALDASHLAFTALKMKADNLNMVGIHDSFGSHLCDMDRLGYNIREAFVELYSKHNPLSQLLWDLGIASNAPMKGSFDIRKVMDSEFFFC